MKFCPMCQLTLETIYIDEQPRTGCPDPACGFVFWDNPLPVVAAIVEHEGHIVLGRNAAWPREFYGLITGFVERNETVEQAVLREVNEELGLESEITQFIGHYPHFRKNELLIAFHVKAEGEIILSPELASIKHVHPADLVPWSSGTGDAVSDWMRKQGYATPTVES